MLTISNYKKYYGDTLVLSIDNLTLASGAFWFKGPNGSGKTTLFKTLAGLIPCNGEIYFDDGTSLRANPRLYRERVAYSEAEPLYPHFLTPLELMRFIGKARGTNRTQQGLVFDKFGITEYQHKAFSNCSSGMVKKVSLALSFVGTPRLIILDEPLITLDETSKNALSTLVKEYITERQVTFLFSSHQPLDENFTGLQGSYLLRDKSLISL